MLGVIGAMMLVFLPGAWITFSLRLSDLPVWAKFLAGTVLAPVVVCVQFYVVRLAGVPFELTVMLLPLLNLPALYLILRQVGQVSLPSRRTVAGWVLVLLVPYVCLVWASIDTQGRLYTAHGWVYSDPIYILANGGLLLEEPDLAGLRYAYPWLGLLYQGILSYLVDSPPVLSYIWTNMLWLLFVFGLFTGIVAELGGNRFSRMASILWLAFGVNFAGSVGSGLAEALSGRLYYEWFGDPRYTPWVIKFLFFEQEPLALGIFAAIAFLLVRQWRSGLSTDALVLIGLLVCGMGLLYPPLFPAVGALVGAKAVALFLESRCSLRAISWRQLLGLGIGLLLAGIVTLVFLRFLTADRVTQAVYRTWKEHIIRKAVTSIVVTLPLTVGLGFAFRKCWADRRSGTIVLLLGALASLGFFVVFYLPGFGNEYKFVFTAAICLAPFPSLALEPLVKRLGRWAWPAFGITALVLASPIPYLMDQRWPWWTADTYDRPALDLSGFELRLADGHRFSGLCEAVRESTPPDSILVLDNPELRFSTLTGRGLYVPPHQKRPHPGVNIVIDDILQSSRGYDMQIVEDRRRVLEDLFRSHSETRIGRSLDRILELERPVAIVLDKGQHTALLEWLVREGRGRSVYEGADLVLWLVEPDSRQVRDDSSRVVPGKASLVYR